MIVDDGGCSHLKSVNNNILIMIIFKKKSSKAWLYHNKFRMTEKIYYYNAIFFFLYIIAVYEFYLCKFVVYDGYDSKPPSTFQTAPQHETIPRLEDMQRKAHGGEENQLDNE